MNHNFKDETGHVYGRLRVLRRSTLKTKPSFGVMWVCYCDPALGGCGSEVVVRGDLMRRGVTRSCGCLRADVGAARMSAYWKNRKENPHE